MASHTISGQRWSDGTTVGVYPAAAWTNRSSAPAGSAVATAAVSGGAVTFTNLADRVRYVAYAGGVGVTFMVPHLNPMDARALRDRVDDLAAAGSIVNWSTVVTAGGSGVDAFAAVQAAVAAAETAASSAVYSPGAATTQVVLGAGIHDMLSGGGIQLTPDPGTRGWVRIVWAPGAIMRLSASCPRGIEFHSTNDYETFRKVRLVNPVINANNVAGNGDAVIGSWVNSVHAQRVSFEDITIDEPHIYNLPARLGVGGQLRAHIWLDSNEPGPPWPGPTQCVMRRIKVLKPRLYGGDMGVGVSCTPATASAPTGTNVWTDDVLVEDAVVELNNGAPPATLLSQSGIIVGGSGETGKVRIIRPDVKYSGDVGIEVDDSADCVIDTPVTQDCKIGWYVNNFHPAADLDRQVTEVRRPRHVVTSAWQAGYSHGFKVGTTNPYGTLKVRNGEWYADGQVWSVWGVEGWTGMAGIVLADIREVDVDGYKARLTGSTFDNGASNASISLLDLATTRVDGKIKAKNLDGYAAYTRTGAGNDNLRVFAVHATDGILHLGPGVSGGAAATSGANVTHYLLGVGEATTGIANSVFRGYITGCVPRAMTGDTDPRGIRFFAGATPGSIIKGASFPVTNCDFTALSGGNADNDIVWADSATKVKLKLAGNAYRNTTSQPFEATKTYDPPSIADGAMTSTTVTYAGAAIGDKFFAVFSLAVPAGAILDAQVTAADTVTVTLFNKTGGALDLASGTLRVVRLASLA